MTQVFGIHIGNSTACIAICKDDSKIEVLANKAGDRVTPAVVQLSSSEQVVGSAAVSSMIARRTSTILRNKCLMDDSLVEDSLDRLVGLSAVTVDTSGKEITYVVDDDDKILKYTPCEVATLILKELNGVARGAAPGQSEMPCVLTVPAHWGPAARDRLTRAAEKAGFIVLQVIHEPPAALLAYRIPSSPEQSGNALVLRIGGCSADCTTLSVQQGFLSVLHTSRSDDIGGEQIVGYVRKYLAQEFKRKYHMDPEESRKSMGKLTLAAQGLVHSLSTLPSASRFIESAHEGVDLSITLSRARLDALIAPLLPHVKALVEGELEACGLAPSQLAWVVLCGGPLKIPRLRAYLGDLLRDAEQVLEGCPPDQVLATGAAIQAGLVASLWSLNDRPTELNDPTFDLPVLHSPITVSINKDQLVFDRHSVLPCSKSLVIPVQEDTLHISSSQASDQGLTLHAQALLDGLKAPTSYEILVKATIENQLAVKATDLSSNLSQDIILELQPQ